MTPSIQRAALLLSIPLGLVVGLAAAWPEAFYDSFPGFGRTWVALAAWTIFGVLHLAYHLGHLADMAAIDAVGNVVALGLSLLVGVALLVPVRHRVVEVVR